MLSDKILDEVRYTNYWRRPLTEWGIETWDDFFFEEIQKSTRKSHQALESELKTLMRIIDRKSREGQKLISIKHKLKDLNFTFSRL